VLVTGGPDEEEELRELAAAAPRPRVAAPVAVACDPLPVLGGWLAAARLLVANDSGAIHLAEAAGTPTLDLAQPEKLVHSHPAGPGCLALFDHREPDPAAAGALDGVAVDQVAAAARHLYTPALVV
jgi:ADP-heptose:LPS heptosyltransferase